MIITNQKLNLGEETSKAFKITFYKKCEQKPGADAKHPVIYTITIRLAAALQTERLMEDVRAALTDIKFDDGDGTLQALQAILTNNANRDANYVSADRSSKFYPMSKDDYFDLGRGVVAIKCYHAKVRSATGRLLVRMYAPQRFMTQRISGR